MDELQKLYDVLYRDGFYTKSFDEFQQQYGDEAYRDKVYDLVSREGYFTGDKDAFNSKYTTQIENVIEETPEKKNTSGSFGLPTDVASSTPLVEGEDTSSVTAVANNDLPVQPDPFAGTILAEQPDDPFDVGVSTITRELIDKEEQYVVPELNYRFNDYGFTFEEAGIGDAMTVHAANGEKISIDLDPVMGDLFGSETEEAKKLTEFLEKNRVASENKLAETSYLIQKKNQQIKSEEDIKATVKLFNEQTEKFRQEVVEFSNAKAQLDKLYEDMFKGMSANEIKSNPEANIMYQDYLERRKQLMANFNVLQQKEQSFSEKGALLDQEVGRYVEMQSQQGGWGGGIWNAITRGASSLSTTATDIMTDFFVEVNPMGAGYNEEEFEKDVTNDAIRMLLESPEDFEMSDTYLLLDEKQDRDILQRLINQDELTEGEQALLSGTLSNYGSETAQEILSGVKNKDGENLVDVARSRTKDAYKKATKYYYAPDAMMRFRETGNVRPRANPFSVQSNLYDTEMGMLDATRRGMTELLGAQSTTEQWANLQKQDFWGGAFLGLAESLPMMLGGKGVPGMVQRTAQMYALTSSHIDEEMSKDPAFDEITENEKYYVKTPVGLAVGALEAIGFRNIINQKGLINTLVARAIGKSSKNTTAKTFQEFIRQDVENLMARGVLTLGAAGAAEFETGFLQEGATIGIKEIFDAAKGKDLFQNPDTFIDIASQMLYAGAQEAVGGFTLGVIPAVSNMAAGGRLAEVDDATFKIFEGIMSDPEYKTMFVTKLKQEVASGKKTQKEADKELANFEKLEGLAPKIPADYNTQQKKEALQLLLEKQDLVSKMEGKEPELVKKEQARVDEINQALEGIQTRAAENLQSQQELEQSIPEFGVQEEVQEDADVTQEERTDIEGFFAEDVEAETTTQNNLFFNRKGKRVNELTPDLKSMRGMVIDIASKAANSIKTILPNTKIVLC